MLRPYILDWMMTPFTEIGRKQIHALKILREFTGKVDILLSITVIFPSTINSYNFQCLCENVIDYQRTKSLSRKAWRYSRLQRVYS